MNHNDAYFQVVTSVPSVSSQRNDQAKELLSQLQDARRAAINAKYDAAQTHIGNENHWAWTDTLGPHAANNLSVRRTLVRRSRYECMENNPYLKGMLLMICNDFVGTGPRLQVTDSRLSPELRRFIGERYHERCKAIKLRKKLWQWRMSKISSGEGVGVAFTNFRLKHPNKVDWQVIETEQLTSFLLNTHFPPQGEVDGIRFDVNQQPFEYHVLNRHPGDGYLPHSSTESVTHGRWIGEPFIVHWFRADRPWLRGIPEITPSLSLCAILRRYTLATIKAAEFAADIAGVLETQGPADQSFWSDFANLGAATGGDTFPVEASMFVTMPWGYKLAQFEQKNLQEYRMIVDTLTREIARPLLVPFNRQVGSSQDSNMASAVVDEQTYKSAQRSERDSCEEDVLSKDTSLWWREGILLPDYFGVNDEITRVLQENPSLRFEPPMHCYRWDQVGIDHTDPEKVEAAYAIAYANGFISQTDIQETRYNRSLEEHQENLRTQIDALKDLEMQYPGEVIEQEPDEGSFNE